MTTQEMNSVDALRAILDNLEMEQSMKNKNESISYINQPEKIAISSNNGEQAQVTYNGQYQNAFYNFTINLPRPALGVKSLELLSVNIPQCQVNLPDESLIFFYYKLKTATNADNSQTVLVDRPGISGANRNMHFVRLLPSYYKKEFVQNYPTLGFNRTFTNYADLAIELEKACANDLLLEKTPGILQGEFIPNDISIVYGEISNKFVLVGNNTDEVWTPDAFILNPATLYQVNNIVTYNEVNYISRLNNNPVNAALIIYHYTIEQEFKKYNIARDGETFYTAVADSQGADVTNTTYFLPSEYDPAVNYGDARIGFNCIYNELWYVSIFPDANTGNQPDISPSFWRLQPYSGTGAVVLKIYDWTSLGYYVANNVAFYEGLYYRAITAQEFVPPTGDPLSSTYWAIINYDDIPATYIPSRWRNDVANVAFNTVYSAADALYYTCIASNTGIDPTDPVEGPNYWIPSGWNSVVNYSTVSPEGGLTNFPVYYEDKWYSSTGLIVNLNKTPTQKAYWNDGTGVMNWWEIYENATFGHTYLSAGYEDPNVFEFADDIQQLSRLYDFDFAELGLGGGLALFSIPPQPIAQYQTLNLRLGFTWDGVYSWDGNTILTGISKNVYRDGSIPAMLFNRLRPVPLYQVSGLSGGVATIPYGDPYNATAYTADGFANLVYSSIINIYTNIVGPSTTDTERNINLLDTVPINCANLGITFYNPVISNKLTKIPNDVYSVYFEFRREDGEPYYFSNNAIITLTLGLTYK